MGNACSEVDMKRALDDYSSSVVVREDKVESKVESESESDSSSDYIMCGAKKDNVEDDADAKAVEAIINDMEIDIDIKKNIITVNGEVIDVNEINRLKREREAQYSNSYYDYSLSDSSVDESIDFKF